MSRGVEIRVTSLSFQDALDRLRLVIAERGLRLFEVIDHQKAAAEVGLALRPTQVLIFGSPTAGTPLMAEWPPLALELPLRIAVWAADDGTARLSYLTAESLVTQFQLNPARVAPLAAPAALVNDALGSS
jgi:uncharacterized protein (DUF302 family)